MKTSHTGLINMMNSKYTFFLKLKRKDPSYIHLKLNLKQND